MDSNCMYLEDTICSQTGLPCKKRSFASCQEFLSSQVTTQKGTGQATDIDNWGGDFWNK